MTSALGVIVLLLAIPGFLMMLKESNVPRIMGGIQQHLPLLYRLLSGFGRWDLQHWVGTLRRNMIEVMRGPKWYLLVGILCTCGWWTLRFGSLLWIAAALNFSISPLDVFWPQFLIYNSMILVPVPVSGGLFETSFLLLYKDMIPAAVMPTTLVLWRFFTYYLFLILGVVTTTRSMWRLTFMKELHYLEDVKGVQCKLHYLRSKDKKEIDFMIQVGINNTLLIEVKLSDDQLSPNFKTFEPYFPKCRKIQIVKNLKKEKFFPDGSEVRLAANWLKILDF
jgi:hypothetical protein